MSLCAVTVIVTGSFGTTSEAASRPKGAGSVVSVVSVVMAADVSPNGDPVRPTANFLVSAPKLVAVVQVGGVPARNAVLTIAWSHQQTSGNTTMLFTRRLHVRSGLRAFSSAVSRGRLAVGVYSVRASIGTSSVTARWMVTALPALSGSVSATKAAYRAAVASTVSFRRTAATSTVRAGPSAPASPLGVPPDPGATGTVPPPGGAPNDGCSITTNASSAGAGGYLQVDTTGCTGDVTQVSADAGAGLKLIGTLKGDALNFFSANPCSLGGEGKAGDTMTFVAQVTSGPDKGKSTRSSASLQPDGDTPFVLVDSTPPDGAFVKPGRKIVVKIEADDPTSTGVASGIAEIKATGDGGRVLIDKTFGGSHPCSKASRTALATTTVPDNPPPFVSITVTARDNAGHSRDVLLKYPTKGVWAGTILTNGSAVAHFQSTCPGAMTDRWFVSLDVTVTSRGAVAGWGDADVRAPFPANCYSGSGVTEEIYRVTGTHDAHAFHLTFDLVNQFPNGFDGNQFVLWHQTPTIDIPLTSDNIAHGTFHLTADVSMITTTLDGDTFLACCSDS